MNPTIEGAKQNDDLSPEVREKIIEAMNEPLEDCVDEKEVPW